MSHTATDCARQGGLIKLELADAASLRELQKPVERGRADAALRRDARAQPAPAADAALDYLVARRPHPPRHRTTSPRRPQTLATRAHSRAVAMGRYRADGNQRGGSPRALCFAK
jgi:hypothetical protein